MHRILFRTPSPIFAYVVVDTDFLWATFAFHSVRACDSPRCSYAAEFLDTRRIEEGSA